MKMGSMKSLVSIWTVKVKVSFDCLVDMLNSDSLGN